jgi:hypothetical protein
MSRPRLHWVLGTIERVFNSGHSFESILLDLGKFHIHLLHHCPCHCPPITVPEGHSNLYFWIWEISHTFVTPPCQYQRGIRIYTSGSGKFHIHLLHPQCQFQPSNRYFWIWEISYTFVTPPMPPITTELARGKIGHCIRFAVMAHHPLITLLPPANQTATFRCFVYFASIQLIPNG